MSKYGSVFGNTGSGRHTYEKNEMSISKQCILTDRNCLKAVFLRVFLFFNRYLCICKFQFQLIKGDKTGFIAWSG